MLAILGLALALLVGGALAVRSAPSTGAWTGRASWRASLAGSVVVLAANAPLWIWASAFAGRGAGDARTHARVAQAIALHGLPHGWTDAYGGGFAVGPHYPFVGWGLAALGIRAGVAPLVAVDAIGFAAILLVPLAAYLLALGAGARPAAALAGALVLSWVAPAGYFVSGYEAYFGQGLLSQVMVVPFVVCLVAGVAREGAPSRATVPAALAVLCHPQVAIAAAVALVLPVAVARDRGAALRFARAGAAMGLVGLAVYGPGIATLKVPFGWPPMEAWKTVGFGTDSLGPWLLHGRLLDVARAPVITAAWGGSALVALALLRRPAARAAVVASLGTVALAVSGSALQAMGAPGAFLLSFLQPLRVLAIVPLVAAATVTIAMEEGAPVAGALYLRVTRGLSPVASRWALRAAPVVLLGLLAGFAFPSRWAVARIVRDKVAAILASYGPDHPCGPAIAGAAEPRPVKSWVASLTRGRLWYDDTAETSVECEFSTAFELDAKVPIAVTAGVGGHVGVHQVAFHQLAPTRAGSAARAEALGVRHVLLFGGEPGGPGWSVTHRSADVVLAERVGGTDAVGVGCVTSVLSGPDEALRARLLADLGTRRGARALLDPGSLVALETTESGFGDREAPLEGCRVEGAVVRESPREPGAFEAEVVAPAPVDVVFRAAAFPTWTVRVDGVATGTRTVAPGFPSVRVGPGRHRVEAVVAPLPGYGRNVAVALLAVGVVSWARRRRAVGRERGGS